MDKNPNDQILARLYRSQVRELEDVAMFVTDPEGVILTWNRGIEEIFGYNEEEWIVSVQRTQGISSGWRPSGRESDSQPD